MSDSSRRRSGSGRLPPYSSLRNDISSSDSDAQGVSSASVLISSLDMPLVVAHAAVTPAITRPATRPTSAFFLWTLLTRALLPPTALLVCISARLGVPRRASLAADPLAWSAEVSEFGCGPNSASTRSTNCSQTPSGASPGSCRTDPSCSMTAVTDVRAEASLAAVKTRAATSSSACSTRSTPTAGSIRGTVAATRRASSIALSRLLVKVVPPTGIVPCHMAATGGAGSRAASTRRGYGRRR
jgi:hypothetical protein